MILEEILEQAGNSGRFQLMFCSMMFCMDVVIVWSMLQAAIVGATPQWWCVPPSSLPSPDPLHLSNLTLHQCSPSPSSLPSILSTLLSSSSPSSDVINGSSSNSSIVSHLGSSSSNNNTSNNNNNSVSYDDVTGMTQECVRYYDPSLESIVSEWDLVCDRKHIKAAINSVQMAGVLVGAVVSGQASDTVGRRVTCYVTMALHALTCLLAGMAPNWQIYAAGRFFVGGTIGAYLVLHYVYMIEFVSSKWRTCLANLPSWPVGAGVMCLAAWQVPNWRYLHYMCAGISVPMLLFWFVSPESVRWLAAKGRMAAAEQVVDMIARINGRSKAPDTAEQLTLLAQEERERGGSEGVVGGQKYAYHTLFRGRRRSVTTLIVAFAWMTLSMSFYGIIFGVSALSGNVFLNMFLLSCTELPLLVITYLLMSRFGRRWISCLFFLLASVTAFGILITDRTVSEESTKGIVINAVAISSKLFISSAWVLMQMFSLELYPTVIRSLGMGAANTAAQVGGILAPIVLEMDTADDAVKCYVIVGSMMAISGFLVLLLKETKGKTLADTLHQDQEEMDI